MKIDFQSINNQADLLALAGRDTQLRKKSVTSGGEWAGPCPICGGRDRFVVQPYHTNGARWLCRHCTAGKWRDAVDFVRLSRRVDVRTACEMITGGDIPITDKPRARESIPAYAPPGEDWQAVALRVIDACETALWKPGGTQALEWLRRRGLADNTIRYFQLGFSYGAVFDGKWVDNEGHVHRGLYIPRGVVIPATCRGEAWYLKIALLPGDPVKCERCQSATPARKPCLCGAVNKYRGVRGQRTNAIFNAVDLWRSDLGLIVEGEINAMIAWQQVGDIIPVASVGAAGNYPDLATWGAYLVGLKHVFVFYDDDGAGDGGAAHFLALFPKATRLALPTGKDINDFHLVGGDLWALLKPHLESVKCNPLCVTPSNELEA